LKDEQEQDEKEFGESDNDTDSGSDCPVYRREHWSKRTFSYVHNYNYNYNRYNYDDTYICQMTRIIGL